MQDAYEERLDASLQCGHDNMHLRAELAAAAAAKAGAVKAAGREAAAEIATSRMQLQRRCAVWACTISCQALVQQFSTHVRPPAPSTA